MTELRKRMIREIRLRNFSPRTEQTYVYAVANLAKFYKTSPDKLTGEQIQEYLLYLYQNRKLAWSSCNTAYSAFRFFYGKVVKQKEKCFCIPPRKREKRLIVPLTKEEVERIILATKNLKHRAFLMTVYGSGVRVGEAVKLRIQDVDAARKMIRVNQGKGRKDRYTLLPQIVEKILGPYSIKYRPGKWLFYGLDPNRPLPVGTAQKIYYQAKRRVGITKGRGIHDLRHAFATHLLDAGYDIFVIKRLLGHRALSTTAKYLDVSPTRIREVKSPVDELNGEGLLFV